MMYRGSISSRCTNSSISIVRVDSSATFSSSFLGDLDIGVGVDLKPLHNVFGGNFLAGICIHPRVLDAMARIPVDLIEADLFGIGSGWVERDGTGDERKAQKAFPIGAGGHQGTPVTGAGFKTNEMPWFRQQRLLSTIISTETLAQQIFNLGGIDFCSLYVQIKEMTDRPASWCTPTPKQMENLAAEAVREAASSAAALDAALPAEYLDSVLK